MRVAVISDVHGNLPALEAVLEHAGQEGFDELWCLGDIVGYGGRPSECLALVRERAADLPGRQPRPRRLGRARHRAVHLGCRRGRALDAQRADARTSSSCSRKLSPKGEREGVSLFHGSIRDPIWEYVLTADVADASLRAQTTELALVGHSHVQLALALGDGGLEGGKAEPEQEVALGRKQLLNPGSVGQPRDRDPRAAWLLLDTRGRLGALHAQRVPDRARAGRHPRSRTADPPRRPPLRRGSRTRARWSCWAA